VAETYYGRTGVWPKRLESIRTLCKETDTFCWVNNYPDWQVKMIRPIYGWQKYSFYTKNFVILRCHPGKIICLKFNWLLSWKIVQSLEFSLFHRKRHSALHFRRIKVKQKLDHFSGEFYFKIILLLSWLCCIQLENCFIISSLKWRAL
jgi:hypothetical protein